MELALRPVCISMMVLAVAFLLGARVFWKKLLQLYRNSRGDDPRARMSSNELSRNGSDSMKKRNERSSDVRYVTIPYVCDNDW